MPVSRKLRVSAGKCPSGKTRGHRSWITEAHTATLPFVKLLAKKENIWEIIN
jgi:hypothetical protein